MKYLLTIFIILTAIHSFGQNSEIENLQQYASTEEATRLLETAIEIYIGNTKNVDTILEAVKILDEVTRLDPKYYIAYERKADLLTTAQQYQKALLPVKNMMRLNPNSAELYRYEGLLYYHLDKKRQSSIAFKKSLLIYEKDLAIAEQLTLKNIDTMAGIKSEGYRKWRKKYWQYIQLKDDEAIGLILTHKNEGKLILDSMNANSIPNFYNLKYKNDYYKYFFWRMPYDDLVRFLLTSKYLVFDIIKKCAQ